MNCFHTAIFLALQRNTTPGATDAPALRLGLCMHCCWCATRTECIWFVISSNLLSAYRISYGRINYRRDQVCS